MTFFSNESFPHDRVAQQMNRFFLPAARQPVDRILSEGLWPL